MICFEPVFRYHTTLDRLNLYICLIQSYSWYQSHCQIFQTNITIHIHRIYLTCPNPQPGALTPIPPAPPPPAYILMYKLKCTYANPLTTNSSRNFPLLSPPFPSSPSSPSAALTSKRSISPVLVLAVVPHLILASGTSGLSSATHTRSIVVLILFHLNFPALPSGRRCDCQEK